MIQNAVLCGENSVANLLAYLENSYKAREILISQGFTDTGIYGDAVIEETIFDIGDEVKLA